MSIAEKLTTIAENVPKVYEQGYRWGEEQGYYRGWEDCENASGGGGAEPVIEAITITENGTYTAPDGVDGYSPVTVDVPSEENLLKYVAATGVIQGLFRQADFSENGVVKDAVKVEIPNSPASLSELFHRAIGIRKITLIVPTTKTYNGYRLASGYSQYTSATGSILEELVIPDGIKFSNFQEFTVYASKLKTISFISSPGEDVKGIDLSSITDTARCFTQCQSLEEVRFVPKSIHVNISFANSPNLSSDSIASIVAGLADLKDQTTQKVELHSNVLLKLTPEQTKLITDKNWTT